MGKLDGLREQLESRWLIGAAIWGLQITSLLVSAKCQRPRVHEDDDSELREVWY